MFADSKECIRDGVCYSLCLRVQKISTRNVSEVVTLFAGSKKYTREGAWLLFEFVGSKKCTRNNVGCFSSLWVQKNVPADRAEWLCVKCCHDMLLAA